MLKASDFGVYADGISQEADTPALPALDPRSPGGEPALRPVRRAHPDGDQPGRPRPRGLGARKSAPSLRASPRRAPTWPSTAAAKRSTSTGSARTPRASPGPCRWPTPSWACAWSAPSAIAIRTTSGSRTISSASPTSSCAFGRPASAATTRRISPRSPPTSRSSTTRPRRSPTRPRKRRTRAARSSTAGPRRPRRKPRKSRPRSPNWRRKATSLPPRTKHAWPSCAGRGALPGGPEGERPVHARAGRPGSPGQDAAGGRPGA